MSFKCVKGIIWLYIIPNLQYPGADAGWLLFCFEIFNLVNKKVLTLFDISFKKVLGKGRLTNEINERAIADTEISDNRNGPQVG